MSLERDNCDECGRPQATCPECGESTVSIDSITTDWGSISPNFEEFAIYAETNESIEYKLVCWECGFEEKREIRIVEGLQPCNNYHPLPCGLDGDCPIPVEYFNADEDSETIYEEWIEDYE